MAREVVIYRTTGCAYCTFAARLLKQKGIAFTEIDVTGDAERRRWMREVSGQSTVPQIFIDGRPIGGFQELAELDRRGALAKLIEE